MTADEAPGRWVVWQQKAPCCGASSVHVYPAHLERIECKCGAWIETPALDPDGMPIVERGVGIN